MNPKKKMILNGVKLSDPMTKVCPNVIKHAVMMIGKGAKRRGNNNMNIAMIARKLNPIGVRNVTFSMFFLF